MLLLAAITFFTLDVRRARALPTPEPEDRAGWMWKPMLVYRNVQPAALSAHSPHARRFSARAEGPVTVMEGHAALVWIGGMETIRVRKTSPTSGATLRFRRLEPGSNGGLALVDIPGVAAGEASWLLTQGSGSGAPWIVEADRPVEVSIEQPRPREGRLIWEHIQQEVLGWVDRGGDFPNLPPVSGRSAFRTRLLAHRRVASAIAAIEPSDRAMDKALQAWRRAMALRQLALIRPLVRPHHVSWYLRWKNKIPLSLPHLRTLVGDGEKSTRPYYVIEPRQSWDVRARGPGVLRVTARALFRGPFEKSRKLAIVVSSGGQEVDRLDIRLQPGTARDPATLLDPIPEFVDAVTDHGDRTSRPVTLSVPLRIGRHEYSIHIEGAPALVKARVAARNHRSVPLARGHFIRAQVTRAQRALKRTSSSGKAIVAWLLSRTRGPVAELPSLPGTLSGHPEVGAWLHLVHAVRLDTDEQISTARRIMARLPDASTPPSSLELEIRRRLFDMFQRLGRPDAAIDAMARRVHSLDTDAFTQLILNLPEHSDLGPMSGALDVRAKGVPFDDDLRRAHRELWRRTRWKRTDPPSEGSSWTWIETEPREPKTPLDDDDLEPDPGKLWPIEPGVPTAIEVPPSVVMRERHALLEASVFSQKADTMRVQVDDEVWHTIAADQPQLFEIAVRPGTHTVRVDAIEPGTQVFVSWPPKPPAKRTDGSNAGPPRLHREREARRRRMWPADREGRPLAFHVGPIDRRTLARLDLRTFPDRADAASPASSTTEGSSPPVPSPIELTIVTDQGQRFPVLLSPGPPDPHSLAERAPPEASARLSVQVPLAPGTKRLWVEHRGSATMAVALYLRRMEQPKATTPATGPALSRTRILQRIRSLNRDLQEHPDDAVSLLRRADLLTRLEARTQARQDVARVLELLGQGWDPGVARRVRDVLGRLRAQVDPRYVKLEPNLPTPMLLSPPLAPLLRTGEELERWKPAIAAALRGIDDVPSTDQKTPTGRAAGAILLQTRGDFERAALQWTRVYVETGLWPAGLAAARAYRIALQASPRVETAALAHGLTRQLRQTVDISTLAKTEVLAARQSHWVIVRGAEQSAGSQYLTTPPDAIPAASPAKRWRWVLSPSWDASDDILLAPNRRVILDLESSKATPRVRSFCRRVWATRPDERPATLELALDGDVIQKAVVPEAGVVEHALGQLGPGRHRVSVTLRDPERIHRCLVHTDAQEGTVTQPRRPSRWVVARPDLPLSQVVLGPTVVRLRLRHGAPHLGRPTRVHVIRTAEGTPKQRTIVVSDDVDPDARVERGTGRPLGVEQEVEILVPEEGPVSLQVRPEFAHVLARVAVRESRPTPLPSPQRDTTHERLARRVSNAGTPHWPAPPPKPLGPTVGEGAEIQANRLGSLEAELRVGRDDLAEYDSDFRPRTRVRNGLAWRREILPGKLWSRIRLLGQWRDRSGIAAGGDATIYGQLGPRRLRGFLRVGAWGEQAGGDPAWSGRVLLNGNRPMQISPRVALIPEVFARYRHQSLTTAEFEALREGVHPEVYNTYVENHPLAVTPGLTARILPMQDQLVSLELSTTPNSRFTSNDHTDAGVKAQGVFDTARSILIGYRAGYQSSLRFEDAHRSRFYVRHRARAGLDFSFLFVGAGRLIVGVRDSLYIARGFPLRNVFDVFVAFEIQVGRGIRDTSPMELNFRELYRLEWWERAREDDLL